MIWKSFQKWLKALALHYIFTGNITFSVIKEINFHEAWKSLIFFFFRSNSNEILDRQNIGYGKLSLLTSYKKKAV